MCLIYNVNNIEIHFFFYKDNFLINGDGVQNVLIDLQNDLL